MGAVICTSDKTVTTNGDTTASHPKPGCHRPGKSLRRKITKDSICDSSSDFVECSSLLHSNGKDKIKTVELEDGKGDAVQQDAEKYSGSSCNQVSSPISQPSRNAWSSKFLPSQMRLKHAWNKKHKTYTSSSTQCVRRLSEDNQSPPISQEETPTEEKTTEKVGASSTTCLEHLTSYLSSDGKCGLCDFVHSGVHHRWDSLEEDAVVLREVSMKIEKWIHSSPKFRDKIILQRSEPKQKIRIVLRRSWNGGQEILITDGFTSYQIQVANPPENEEEKPETENACNDVEQTGAQDSNNGAASGSGLVIRRMNPRGGQLLRSKAQESDSVDQAENRLPPVDTMEACNKAAERLRELANHLQHGEVPISVLQKALQYAACVLDTVCIDDSRTKPQENRVCSPGPQLTTERPATRRKPFSRLASKSSRRTLDDEDELSEFQPNAVPTEVREWLASTFTKKTTNQRRRSEDKPRFRSVANAIRAGIMVDRLYRRMSSTTSFYIPTHISLYLKNLHSQGLDDYSFDVFALNDTANGQGLRYLAYDLLNRYGLTHKFKIPSSTMENFMSQVLQGYVRHKNPYHNDLHAADVTQTVHYMLCQQGLANWLTDLEIFAALIAAIIHDFEHTGTTNNFHVMSRSDTALLYNDRAVLENHHVSTAFRLMREEDSNILFHLSKEEYKEFRHLVIDMVLATDMSSHFQQIKSIKSLIGHSDFSIDKSKALALILHCCDISHPSKNWDLHHRWTLLLMEEFFLQGDKEKALGLPYSPLCDRNTTLIAESQIGFIDFIVAPSLEVCGEMLEKIEGKMQSSRAPPITEAISEEGTSTETKPSALRRKSQSLTGAITSVVRKDSSEAIPVPAETEGASSAPPSPKAASTPFKSKIKKPWVTHLEENKIKWKERTHRDAELRAQLSVMHDDNDGAEPPMRVVV